MRGRGLLRGISGVLAGGLVGLFVVLLAGWAVTTRAGAPGPGAWLLVGHGLAAAVAVAAQVVADRRRGVAAVLASVAVLGVAVAVLVGYWL